ncbi:hypothetical protein RvY_13592 [Ramazzottius varieornatus]|uniref:L-Fucosyltransferase n=1 Tax=Ramazzottius varieornatus TaxID=947166 RepID=A0A1D1VNF9_RAMVA|nr:hypothetical protein RvY_13592 [Ramazzottius varieornatus]
MLLLEWQRSYRRNGLGNQLFLYASLLGIASRNHLHPIMPSYSPVIKVFTLGGKDLRIADPEAYDTLVCKGRSLPQPEIYSAFCCTYFSFTEKLKNHVENDVVLHGAFQSWKYFHPEYSAEIKQSLKFRADIILEADTILENITKDLHSDTELVGIHVRRGDILRTHLRQFGHVPAPGSYFQRSREYLDSRHTSLFYVVVTNDVPWAKEAISGLNAVVLEKVKPEVALALLTKMKHLIISTGTFSWWAAYLSDAVEVLYFNGTPTPLSFYDITFRAEDYYLPNWKGLS